MTSCVRIVRLAFFPAAVLALSLALAGATEAHSGSHTARHTPFAVVKAETAMHCPLDGHALKQYCPHAVHFMKIRTQVTQIDRDCGGNASGKTPAKPGFDNKPAFAELPLSVNRKDAGSLFYYSSLFHSFVLPDSPEHPPRFF